MSLHAERFYIGKITHIRESKLGNFIEGKVNYASMSPLKMKDKQHKSSKTYKQEGDSKLFNQDHVCLHHDCLFLEPKPSTPH